MIASPKTTRLVSEAVYYPETDGKPMAESDLHRDRMFALIHLLQRYFAGQEVYVSGNLLLYYVEGNPRKSVAPDCFVVWGVSPHFRRVYKVWEEKAPRVVFEVSSKSTQREDIGAKMRLYAELGIEEYYIYDPTAEYLDPPLAAFRLAGEGYIPVAPINDEVRLGELAFVPGAGEPPEFDSPLLGLRLTLDEENQLTFYDLSSGERLLSDEEARIRAEALAVEANAQATQSVDRAEQAENRAEQAENRAEQAENRAEQAESRAEQAENRAEQAEAENARLRAELARLRSG